jgi:hypothetical protein
MENFETETDATFVCLRVVYALNGVVITEWIEAEKKVKELR